MLFSVPTIRYKNRIIINECKIEVEDCSITSICGINGSGKTLLLNSLFSYCINNNISACMMDQSSEMVLYRCSVLENIAMSNDPKEIAYALELLQKYDLEHLINHSIKELSGGEKRFICLLRCLFNGADFYFFDEPTNDLDYLMVDRVIRLIKDLAEISTVIIVSHDDRIVSTTSQSYIIENKEINENKKLNVHEQKTHRVEMKKQHSKREKLSESILVRSISFLSVSRILLCIFSVCILYFCFLYHDSAARPINGLELAQNEVVIFVPLSDYASAALSEGAIPIWALDSFNDNQKISDKADLFDKLFDNAVEKPINFGLTLDDDERWIQFECEFYDIKDRKIVYPLEEYSEKYENGRPIDTSSYFYSFYDWSAENRASFNADRYLQLTNEIKKRYNTNQFECTWLVVCLQDVDFYEFISSEKVAELMGGNFFVVSSETVDFVSQVRAFIQLKQHVFRCGVAAGIFVFLTLCSSVIWGINSIVPIKVFRNSGINKESLIKPIHKCIRDTNYFSVCFILTNILLICLPIKYGTANLISSFAGNIIYILICAVSRLIQIKLSNVYILRAYNWRIR